MKHRSRQRRVGQAIGEHLEEVFELARAAGRDDGNRDRGGDG